MSRGLVVHTLVCIGCELCCHRNVTCVQNRPSLFKYIRRCYTYSVANELRAGKLCACVVCLALNRRATPRRAAPAGNLVAMYYTRLLTTLATLLEWNSCRVASRRVARVRSPSH